MKVYGLTPFTMQDFPDRLAAIVWIGGCNFRCPYCHNPEIVFGKNSLAFDEVERFLQRRIKRLDGVVLSGGEPTLHPHIVEIAQRIKSLGFALKLDTNGTKPAVIQELLQRELLDFVALDIKASAPKYEEVTKADLFDEVQKSLELLIGSKVELEVRTTVHTALLDEKDIEAIGKLLVSMGYKGTYYVQNFVEAPKLLGSLGPQERLLEPIALDLAISYRNF